MITATSILIGKILILMLLIGAMVVLLLGINCLFHNDDSKTLDETELLRNDVDEGDEVISDRSVFYNFLVKATRESKTNNKNKSR